MSIEIVVQHSISNSVFVYLFFLLFVFGSVRNYRIFWWKRRRIILSWARIDNGPTSNDGSIVLLDRPNHSRNILWFCVKIMRHMSKYLHKLLRHFFMRVILFFFAVNIRYLYTPLLNSHPLLIAFFSIHDEKFISFHSKTKPKIIFFHCHFTL